MTTKTPLSIAAVLLLLLFCGFLLSPTTAKIKKLKIRADDRPMILFGRFGFSLTGVASISVSSVSVNSSSLSQPDPSRLGFFLLSDESLIPVLLELQQNPYFCVIVSHYINPLFTFRDLSPPPHSSFNNTFNVIWPNEYSLFFANCAPESQVSMDVRTEFYNLDVGDNTTKDYLSAGLTQLPSLYSVFSLVYIVFFGYWAYNCFRIKPSVLRIHLLMGGLLVMKALNLICAAEYKHYVKVTGTPHGWNVLFYIFHFITVLLLFTVIVLIGTGCSFLKPPLQDKGKKVLMIVIPLQVLANVASVVIGETGPFIKDLVDIACCCAILFPIVWSIRLLREKSKTDGKAARNLAKLTQFYIVVVGYLFFTRIVVFDIEIYAAYKYRWVSSAAEEVASLAFCLVIFYMFRPVEKNEYFVLDEEEEKEAKMALLDKEFEL